MMIKRAALIIISLITLLACCGCQLAVEGQGSMENTDALCGAFITFEYLNVDDSFVDSIDWNAAMNGGQTPFYDPEAQKIYAARNDGTHTEYYFEGIEGQRLFNIFISGEEENTSYSSSYSDALLMDRKSAYNVTDEGTEITIEATLYVCPRAYGGGEELDCYLNPVYQTPDGQVYMTPGSGLGADLSEGCSISQTLSGSTEKTVNGEKEIRSASVKVTVTAIDEIKKYVLKQLDDKDQVISSLDIVKDNIPKEAAFEDKTVYAILEKHCVNAEGKAYIERSFADMSQDYMGIRFINEDGFAEAFVITLKNLPAKQ